MWETQEKPIEHIGKSIVLYDASLFERQDEPHKKDSNGSTKAETPVAVTRASGRIKAEIAFEGYIDIYGGAESGLVSVPGLKFGQEARPKCWADSAGNLMCSEGGGNPFKLGLCVKHYSEITGNCPAI